MIRTIFLRSHPQNRGPLLKGFLGFSRMARRTGNGRTETLANGWDQPEAVGEVLRLRRRRSGRPLVPAVSRSRLSAAISSAGDWADVTANVRRLSAKVQRSRARGTYSPSQRRLDKGAPLNGCDRRKWAESPCAILVASFFDGAHRGQQRNSDPTVRWSPNANCGETRLTNLIEDQL